MFATENTEQGFTPFLLTVFSVYLGYVINTLFVKPVVRMFSNSNSFGVFLFINNGFFSDYSLIPFPILPILNFYLLFMRFSVYSMTFFLLFFIKKTINPTLFYLSFLTTINQNYYK